MTALRFPASMSASGLMTVSLFLLMSILISDNDTQAGPSELFHGIHFGPVEIPEPRDPVRPQPPKKPEPPKRPPTAPSAPSAPTSKMPVLDLDIDVPDLGMPGDGAPMSILGGANQSTAEGGAVPTVIIRPMYPRQAALSAVEGWVKVGFTITPTGTVEDAHVINAEPPRVFNKEALRAIRRWKFKPRIIGGTATRQQATQVIQFQLDND